MSLLNNALREAEERQRRPEVTGAYTGAVQQGSGRQPWLVILVLLLITGLVGAAVYWFTMRTPSPEGLQTPAVADGGDGQVERRSDPASQPEPEVEPETEQTLPEAEAAAPQVPEPQQAESGIENVQIAPAPRQVAEAPEPAPAQEPEQQAEPVPASQPRPEPEQAPVVKSTPQSPEAIDRQTAKELERLIADGRMVDAERRLASLTRSQSAPRSRFVVARALVVDGDIQRALSWLPEEVAAASATLRMLRARAQHASGNLDTAVMTLKSNVPTVAASPEYRVTLATLLQQQGQSQQAAAHWAELIAWDDSRAPWWVGLAVALEARGETRGASRAYQQAARLPGLSPSLADYVQRRLQSLGAG